MPAIVSAIMTATTPRTMPVRQVEAVGIVEETVTNSRQPTPRQGQEVDQVMEERPVLAAHDPQRRAVDRRGSQRSSVRTSVETGTNVADRAAGTAWATGTGIHRLTTHILQSTAERHDEAEALERSQARVMVNEMG